MSEEITSEKKSKKLAATNSLTRGYNHAHFFYSSVNTFRYN